MTCPLADVADEPDRRPASPESARRHACVGQNPARTDGRLLLVVAHFTGARCCPGAHFADRYDARFGRIGPLADVADVAHWPENRPNPPDSGDFCARPVSNKARRGPKVGLDGL